MQITARHFRTGQVVDVRMSDERIESIRPSDMGGGVELPYVAPGLIDIQVNGFGGSEFDQEQMKDKSKWEAVAHLLLDRGVTMFLPTFCTNSHEGFVRALEAYSKTVQADPRMAHVMPGVHVEGPFISDQDGPRGAHNRAFTRDCNLREVEQWIAACGRRLRILTLAPERKGAADLTRELTRRGVTVSIAHTAASVDQLDAVVRAGAKFSTHLGNGSHVMINRHRNYFYDQLADDRLWASVIPDGHHVPSSLFRIVLRAKGLSSVVLTSDSCGQAGMAPGVYGGSTLDEDGRLHLTGNHDILAGSAISLDQGVGRAMEMAGISMGEAIDLCTVQPAMLLGMKDRGRLEEGAIADVILFNWNADQSRIEVVDTIVRGRSIHAGRPRQASPTA
ncbi:MAG: N-acetylglucosamine-6-phosphate deacetylase [Phycisphaerae bacterium]|nr:N-acetylglucosamine-6-phosphate deacetylase [Phycisphaerae bacterium]